MGADQSLYSGEHPQLNTKIMKKNLFVTRKEKKELREAVRKLMGF